MAATGTEAVQLSQLKDLYDSISSDIDGKQDALTLPLTIANGGTGQTSAAEALSALGGVNSTYVTNQLANYIAKPSEGNGTSGQVLQTNGDGTTTWASVSAGTTYTGSNGITVEGSTISGVTAAAGTVGVVMFASDDDFNEYMGVA